MFSFWLCRVLLLLWMLRFLLNEIFQQQRTRFFIFLKKKSKREKKRILKSHQNTIITLVEEQQQQSYDLSAKCVCTRERRCKWFNTLHLCWSALVVAIFVWFFVFFFIFRCLLLLFFLHILIFVFHQFQPKQNLIFHLKFIFSFRSLFIRRSEHPIIMRFA